MLRKNYLRSGGHTAVYASDNNPTQEELADTAANVESARLLKDVNKRLYDYDYIYNAPDESKISKSAFVRHIKKVTTAEGVIRVTHIAITMLNKDDQREALNKIAQRHSAPH